MQACGACCWGQKVKRLIFTLLHITLNFPATIGEGYIITRFWHWFVVSQFPTVVEISIGHAAGLSLLMVTPTFMGRWMRTDFSKDDDDNERLALKITFIVIGLPLFWAFGYAIHWFST